MAMGEACFTGGSDNKHFYLILFARTVLTVLRRETSRQTVSPDFDVCYLKERKMRTDPIALEDS